MAHSVLLEQFINDVFRPQLRTKLIPPSMSTSGAETTTSIANAINGSAISSSGTSSFVLDSPVVSSDPTRSEPQVAQASVRSRNHTSEFGRAAVSGIVVGAVIGLVILVLLLCWLRVGIVSLTTP